MGPRYNYMGRNYRICEVTTARSEISPVESVPLLGDSPQMQLVREQIRRVGPTQASVLLTGESGSGKELAARAVHEQSARAGKAFVAINCGAIAHTLIEAELFGYEKGAFTGAVRDHAGVFERADQGTLFLDEIAEMPSELQVRLLRVLETARFYRVGGMREIAVDVRVIAATNRCLMQAIQDRTLREDLIYRLAVFPIELPALRERGGDVEQLADYFLTQLNESAGAHKQFSDSSLVRMRRHSWPGNVRELRNAVERAYILADRWVELAPLQVGARALIRPHRWQANVPLEVGLNLKEAERSLIEATLQHFDGNKTQTAVALGCSLKTLYNKLHGYTRDTAFSHS
jgi:DNA-binding NtrC family response regulator